MAIRLRRYFSSFSLMRSIASNARLAVRLMREPRVPLMLKALPILGLGYVLSPLDFVPDVIPILGQLDDIGIMALAIEGFLKLTPGDAVAFHRAAIAEGRRYAPMVRTGPGEYIDAEFRRD
jgi:uncharacterized membrane protein YkvA (DUF1232 family)